MKNIYKIIIAFLIIGAFFYGIMAGHYKIFPFNQLLNLKFKISEIINPTEVVPPPENAEPVKVIDTALQRLLVKEIRISNDPTLGRGGAMTTNGFKVFVTINSDSLKKEFIEVYDFQNYFKYKSDSLRVPMNYEKLLYSSLAEKEYFDLDRFRVHGLYTEKIDENNYSLFVTHHYYEEDENCISINLSKTEISFTDSTVTQEADWETLFKATPCVYPEENVGTRNPFPGQMSAGKMLEYDDETLLVSIGGFSTDYRLYPNLPMDDSTPFGKILLIDKETGKTTIFAKGLRNSQGMFIDSNGTFWATDQGPEGGDELNIINRNGNYGWPEETYGIHYETRPWPLTDAQGRVENYQKPIYAWIPSLSPTDIVQIQDEEKFPLWNGDLLVGSYNLTLNRIRFKEDNSVVYNERIKFEHRLRELEVLPDGKILIYADFGSLLILEDGGPVYEDMDSEAKVRMASLDNYNQLARDINKAGGVERALTAEAIFAQNCSSCHLLTNNNSVGPHLNNLFDRQVGGLQDYNYSYTLEENKRQWNPELLRSFLLEPENQFQFIKMQKVPLTSNEVDSIITVLQN